MRSFGSGIGVGMDLPESGGAHRAGERTGRIRLGAGPLLTAAYGNSRISVANQAVAMIDELERPAHRRRRFLVTS